MYWPSNLAEPCAHATLPSPVLSRRPSPSHFIIRPSLREVSQRYISREIFARKLRRCSGRSLSTFATGGRPPAAASVPSQLRLAGPLKRCDETHIGHPQTPAHPKNEREKF